MFGLASETVFRSLLCMQLFTTFAMTGLIWLVQLVHYPLFDRVDDSKFVQFESDHSNGITVIVLPLMVAELASAVLLAILRGGRTDAVWWYAGLAAVVLLWASTFFLSVPEHSRLMQGFDADSHRRLVLTNWPRTILWSLRSGGLLFILWGLVRTPID